ncbi:hypothetical protein A0H81_03643 [Grifola frondosa]|uniref:Uncharacterized protein n=1 Tax=Grifola frondosa TaxID=5627 RepID=A0A1C7MN13_GRIFR|nr:hypothetical protein A0H81_03643 [Grifola frondosa]
MLELRNVKESRGWVIRETHSPGAQLKDAGRMINRKCGNHINIPELVTRGVALHNDPEPVVIAQEMEAFKNIVPKDIEKYLKAWGTILRRVPFMPALMPDLAISLYGVVLLGAFLDAHARSARSDDLSMLRYDTMLYIEEVRLDGMIIHYQARCNKMLHGFKDLATTCLLTPCRLRDDFNANPELFCCNVCEGTMRIKSCDYPLFMYPEDGYKKGRSDYRLCRGLFLIQYFHHIFTGKCNATVSTCVGLKGRPGPVAELNKMSEVTPENIGYVAVLVCFILNDQDAWHVDDNKFNSPDFYNSLIHLFSNAEWCTFTLKWWNEEVFGNNRSDSDDKDDGDNTYVQILAQCAAIEEHRCGEEMAQRALKDQIHYARENSDEDHGDNGTSSKEDVWDHDSGAEDDSNKDMQELDYLEDGEEERDELDDLLEWF